MVAREEEELPPDCFEPFGQNIAWRVLAFRPCFCVKHATHWPAAVSSFLTMFALSDNFPVLYICFVRTSSPPPKASKQAKAKPCPRGPLGGRGPPWGARGAGALGGPGGSLGGPRGPPRAPLGGRGARGARGARGVGVRPFRG